MRRSDEIRVQATTRAAGGAREEPGRRSDEGCSWQTCAVRRSRTTTIAGTTSHSGVKTTWKCIAADGTSAAKMTIAMHRTATGLRARGILFSVLMVRQPEACVAW